MIHSIRYRLYAGYAAILMIFGVGPLLLLSPSAWSSGNAMAFYVTLLAFGGLVGLLVAHLGFSSLSRSIEAVSEELAAASDGQFGTLPVESAPNELGALIRSYNAMSVALSSRERELHAQLRRTALLIRLSIELRESLDPRQIVQDILTVILGNTDANNASIILTRPEGGVELAIGMSNGVTADVKPASASAIIADGLGGWVLRHGSNVVLGDVRRDPRWIEVEDVPLAGSAMVLMLTYRRATFGVLTITHPDRDHFTSSDLLLLEGVAAQAGVALNAAQRHVEERRYREQALLLFSMSQFLTSQRSVCDLAIELLDKSSAVFATRYSALFLTKDPAVEPALFVDRPGAEPGGFLRNAGADAAMLAAARRAWSSREMVTEVLQHGDHGLDIVCVALPLQHNGTAMGAFLLVHEARDGAVFSARIWSLLTIFTNVAASAFANMMLLDQLHQRAEELEQLVDERTMQLQRSRDLLRIVFDNLPDGLVLADAGGTVLTTNQAFAQGVLALRPQEIVGNELSGLLAEAGDRGLKLEELPSGEHGRRVRVASQESQQRWFDVDRFAIGDESEPQWIERWRDVTTQEELHRKLLLHEQLSSMGRLAATVVHEVGNPLQSVRSCLDLCREDAALPSSATEYLDMAQGELDRIGQMLARWRDLYRPAQLTWRTVDLNRLIGIMRQLTERQLARQQINVTLDLAPELPPIYGQADALRQVLLNLVLNAQDAMPNGGSIRIATLVDRERRTSGFRVTDTGTGMSHEQLERIFEPFSKSQPQKLGLGLYLSRQIIQQHRGTLDIASTEGVGTIVTVTLPWIETNHDES